MVQYITKIRRAIRANDIDLINTYLENDPNLINLKFFKDVTILHIAVGYFNDEDLQRLIRQNNPIKPWYPDINLISNLLEKGANPNIPNNEGVYPIMTAIANNYLDIFNLLVNHPTIEINVKDRCQRNIMDYAIIRRNVEFVKIIYNLGYKVELSTFMEHINNEVYQYILELIKSEDGSITLLNKVIIFDEFENDEDNIDHLNRILLKKVINEYNADILITLLDLLPEDNYVIDDDLELWRIIVEYVQSNCYEMFNTLYSYPLYKEAIKRVFKLHDGDKYTILHYAADNSGDDGSFFQLILDIWLELGLSIDLQDNQGKTPLYIAIERTNDDIIKILIENNADINISDYNNNYPIFLMIENISDELTSYLFDNNLVDIDIINRNKYNIFNYAIIHDNVCIVEKLLNIGYDVNMVYVDTKKSPLLLAIECDSYETIIVLLEYGANIRYSHLKKALLLPRRKIFYLLWANVNFTLTEWQLYQLLSCADNINLIKALTNFDNEKHIKYDLLDNLNINQRCEDYFQQTVLHKAVYLDDIDLVRHLLLNLNAFDSLHITNIHGNTPLHTAALHSSLEIVTLLLDAGSDKTIKNVFNNTPEESAKFSRRSKIASFIRDYDPTFDVKEVD